MDEQNQAPQPIIPSSPKPEQATPPAPTSPSPQPPVGDTKINKRGLLKVILLAVGIVGVFIALVVVLGIWLFASTRDNVKQATSFVDDIKTANYSAAYEYFAPELQAAHSLDIFTGQVKALNLNSSCNLAVTGLETSSNTQTATQSKLTGKVICQGVTYQATFVFSDTEQSDGEKIVAYQIYP